MCVKGRPRQLFLARPALLSHCGAVEVCFDVAIVGVREVPLSRKVEKQVSFANGSGSPAGVHRVCFVIRLASKAAFACLVIPAPRSHCGWSFFLGRPALSLRRGGVLFCRPMPHLRATAEGVFFGFSFWFFLAACASTVQLCSHGLRRSDRRRNPRGGEDGHEGGDVLRNLRESVGAGGREGVGRRLGGAKVPA